MITEGLSLNPHKTTISNDLDINNRSRDRLTEVFSDAERASIYNKIQLSYGNEDSDESDEDDTTASENPFLNGKILLERLSKIDDNTHHEFSARKAILRTLRQFPDFDIKLFIDRHARLAYFLPRDFCRAIQAGCNMISSSDKKDIAIKIFELLRTPPMSELPYARTWLLNLFASGTLPAERHIIDAFDASATTMEKRQLLLIRSRLNDKAFFRHARGQLGQIGEWLKPAYFMGALCLPRDEYSHWIDIAAKQTQDPFATLFASWLKETRSSEPGFFTA